MAFRERNKREKRMEWNDRAESRNARLLEGIKVVDYKDAELLRKFMTERGRVMPRRLTGASAKQQRQIKRAIRRARVMGLVL